MRRIVSLTVARELLGTQAKTTEPVLPLPPPVYPAMQRQSLGPAFRQLYPCTSTHLSRQTTLFASTIPDA